MDADEQIEVLKEFCRCVLDESKDSSDFLGLTNKEKQFCNKYYSQFAEIETEIDNELLITLVRIQCDQYCKSMLLNDRVPFSFYNKEFLDNYVKSFNEFCLKNYKVNIPDIIKTIIGILNVECIEYQNISLHIQQAINNSENTHIDRMNFIDDRINNLYDIIENTTSEATKRLQGNFNSQLEETTKKYNESSIAVLGIFSAVVLTFNAALTFTSSVMESISSASIYRIAFISLIIGLVLFNVLFGLFTFILNIVKNGRKQNYGVLITTNVLIVAMIGILVFSWSHGTVEERNRKIADAQVTVSECPQESTSSVN